MNKFKVVTDSTSDIEKEYREQYDIDYIKMVYTFHDVTYDADVDWSNMNPSDYYGKMRETKKRAVTGLVKTDECETVFNKYLSEGVDVLYIACSGKLSASCKNAKLVYNEMADKYPNNKVVCFDSLRSNYAEAMIAMKASELANEGKTIDEAVEILNEEKLKYQTFCTVGSLDYLKLAGRVKAGKAFFGNLLGVKPLIVGDAKGNNYAYDKAKGRKNSLDALVSVIKERIESNDTLCVIEHADCLQDAQYILNQLKDKLTNIHICTLGPIIGATVGPDSITVNFYGKKVEIFGEE